VSCRLRVPKVERVLTAISTKQKKQTPDIRKSDQKEVDAALCKNIAKVPQLADYIASSFSLSKGDRPHLMQF
jgi:large subunit ribosomal protein L6e